MIVQPASERDISRKTPPAVARLVYVELLVITSGDIAERRRDSVFNGRSFYAEHGYDSGNIVIQRGIRAAKQNAI